jgi:hypothetical protein
VACHCFCSCVVNACIHACLLMRVQGHSDAGSVQLQVGGAAEEVGVHLSIKGMHVTATKVLQAGDRLTDERRRYCRLPQRLRSALMPFQV